LFKIEISSVIPSRVTKCKERVGKDEKLKTKDGREKWLNE